MNNKCKILSQEFLKIAFFSIIIGIVISIIIRGIIELFYTESVKEVIALPIYKHYLPILVIIVPFLILIMFRIIHYETNKKEMKTIFKHIVHKK